jgi:hypothetical protein
MPRVSNWTNQQSKITIDEIRERDAERLEEGKELIEDGMQGRVGEDEHRQLIARIHQIAEL